MAIAHTAMLDGADLSLAMLGHDPGFRLNWIKRHHFNLLISGFVGGILSFILSVTLLGWFFLLPSLYVGAFLLVIEE